MGNNELETRSFLEDAKNLCIIIKTDEIEQKQYITHFDKLKDYKTSNDKLIIGNGTYDVLNLIIKWIKVEIIKNSLVIPICKGNIIIEEF